MATATVAATRATGKERSKPCSDGVGRPTAGEPRSSTARITQSDPGAERRRAAMSRTADHRRDDQGQDAMTPISPTEAAHQRATISQRTPSGGEARVVATACSAFELARVTNQHTQDDERGEAEPDRVAAPPPGLPVAHRGEEDGPPGRARSTFAERRCARSSPGCRLGRRSRPFGRAHRIAGPGGPSTSGRGTVEVRRRRR